ncbi:MAG TPA: hypothetical protein VFA18_22660 [Gemmataceae bacterium]|nr:hypothetical protein [Gemmataceae bacterium]
MRRIFTIVSAALMLFVAAARGDPPRTHGGGKPGGTGSGQPGAKGSSGTQPAFAKPQPTNSGQPGSKGGSANNQGTQQGFQGKGQNKQGVKGNGGTRQGVAQSGQGKFPARAARAARRAPYQRFGARGVALNRGFQGWSYYAWSPTYGCRLYYDPDDGTWYYWYPRGRCFLPWSYITVYPPPRLVRALVVRPRPVPDAPPPINTSGTANDRRPPPDPGGRPPIDKDQPPDESAAPPPGEVQPPPEGTGTRNDEVEPPLKGTPPLKGRGGPSGKKAPPKDESEPPPNEPPPPGDGQL